MTLPILRRVFLKPWASTRGSSFFLAGMVPSHSRFWIFLGGLIFSLAATPRLSPAAESFGTLYFAKWGLSVWGAEEKGAVCWLRAEGGRLRLDVARDLSGGRGEPDLNQLLHRQGEGWTLAIPVPGSGTFNTWGKEWKKVRGDLARWAELLTGLLERGPSLNQVQLPSGVQLLAPVATTCQRPRWLESLSEPVFSTRVQLPAWQFEPISEEGIATLGSVTSFRSVMRARGRGRGADKEILTIRWDPGRVQTSAIGASITSSRRGGRLLIEALQEVPVRYSYPESFLPLWPLAESIDLRGDSQGP
jgi:hypothetical protein